MSNAPGAQDQVCNPIHLASVADFLPTHFEEPQSDGLLDAWQGQEVGNQDRTHNPTSPMMVVPNMLPSSSPFSQNPLLCHASTIEAHTPSPARRHSNTLCMHDANKAWLAAEGLVPVTDNFHTPGFVPAQLVGGITYKVHSPRSQCLGIASASRKLFGEH